MTIRSNDVVSRLALTALLLALIIPVYAYDPSNDATFSASWSNIAGQILSSVVWSPEGDYIAFVSNPKYPDSVTQVPSADIWLLKMPVQDGKANLKRLARFTASDGIPSALFWLSNHELGWASSGIEDKGAMFYTTNINMYDSRPLIYSGFRLNQTLSDIEDHTLEDVYWDARARVLWFSCAMPALRSAYEHLSEGAIGFYDTNTRNISFSMLPGYNFISLCAWTKDHKVAGYLGGTTFYYAATSSVSRTPYRGIFRADMVNPNSEQKLWGSSYGLSYPRISPDGNVLAWLEVTYRSGKEIDEIVLRDLKTDKNTVLVRLPQILSQYQYPKLGCPFSWSPDGKEIAYVDGSEVKIVNVPSEVAQGKK